jgi:hypothetical protein
MRIISNFKDYYDSGRAYGEDTDNVYVRKTLEMDGSDTPFSEALNEAPWTMARVTKNYREFLPGFLLFCGYIYPFYRYSAMAGTNLYLWQASDVHDVFRSYMDPDEVTAYARNGFNWNTRLTQKTVEEFFQQKFLEQNAINVHHDTNCPCVMLQATTEYVKDKRMLGRPRHVQMIQNPVLQDTGFYRVLDTYSAFQELSMFVGGVLRSTENAMVNISNEDKIAKHGFDEWSFRKKVR